MIWSRWRLMDHGDGQVGQSGPGGSPGEASCNTPPSSPFNRHGTCIDYLKVTFPHGFEKDRDKFSDLLELMVIDEDASEAMRSMHGFNNVLRIAPGTNLAYGGTMTIRKSGEETTMIEMSGEGCRDFEDRYFSRIFMKDQTADRGKTIRKAWIELIEMCRSLDGTCKRIDLPTDDYSGDITVEDIKKKVALHEYSTQLRALEVTDQKGDGDLKDVKTVRDSKLSGYSATFGTRKSLQLCIYDKLAERMSKGIDPHVESWMRFEVRFYHDRADQELRELLAALKAGTESAHIVGCLAAVINFKEPSGRNDAHKCLAHTWAKWTEMTKAGSEVQAFSVSPRVMSIESNASWLVREGGKSFLRILTALDGKGFAAIGSALGIKALGKMTKADLQYVNQYRKATGCAEFESLDELRSYVLGIPDLVVEFDGPITDLLLGKRSKKEIQRIVEARKRAKNGQTDND